jgi:hypothetical protein
MNCLPNRCGLFLTKKYLRMAEYNVDDRLTWFHIFSIAFESLINDSGYDDFTGPILVHSIGCMPGGFEVAITELIE